MITTKNHLIKFTLIMIMVSFFSPSYGDTKSCSIIHNIKTNQDIHLNGAICNLPYDATLSFMRLAKALNVKSPSLIKFPMSPIQQIKTLSNLIDKKPPDIPTADKLMQVSKFDNGWTFYGTTGKSLNRQINNQQGWYIGWAQNANQTYIFIHLDLEDQPAKGSVAKRAKRSFLFGFANLID